MRPLRGKSIWVGRLKVTAREGGMGCDFQPVKRPIQPIHESLKQLSQVQLSLSLLHQ